MRVNLSMNCHKMPRATPGRGKLAARGVSRNVPTELRTQPQKDAMDLPHGVSRCVPTGLPMVLQGAGKRVTGTVFPHAAT